MVMVVPAAARKRLTGRQQFDSVILFPFCSFFLLPASSSRIPSHVKVIIADMADMDDELSSQLQDLALSSTGQSQPQPFTTAQARSIAAAFGPPTSSRTRTLAFVALSRLASDTGSEEGHISATFEPIVRSDLAETQVAPLQRALRLLAALYSVSPPEAHKILAADALLDTAIEAPDSCEDPGAGTDSVDLALAELLGAAAGYGPSRSLLADSSLAQEWLEKTFVRASAKGNKRELSVAVSVARIKLQRGKKAGAETSVGLEGVSQPSRQQGPTREEDEKMLKFLRAQILASADSHMSNAKDSSPSDEAGEAQRASTLAALEGLTYLTLSPRVKETVSSDEALLKALCAFAPLISRRSVFPRAAGNDAASMYTFDSTDPRGADAARYDSALQYGLACIFSNLTSYRPPRSAEEAQMLKLRALANARGGGGAAGPKPEELEEENLDAPDAVAARCAKALGAGVVPALVALATVRSPSNGATPKDSTSSVNPSAAVRQAVGSALLGLVTAPDKAQRGRVAQQGGVRALLALALPLLSSASAGPATPASPPAIAEPELQTLQALTKLCITSDPVLLFGSPSAALAGIPPLAALFLADTSSRLQRFEATLALTNLASIGVGAATAVARAAPFAPTSKSTSAQVDTEKLSIASKLEERILLEDHPMSRRACVELLCNLVQDEQVFASWSGEEEEEQRASGKQSSAKAITAGEATNVAEPARGVTRAEHRLHLLVALCAPSTNTNQGLESASASTETSLPTRLAATGALASLTSSATACAHLLALRPRTLNILARTLRPGTGIRPSPKAEEPRIKELAPGDDGISSSPSREDDDEETDEEAESRAEQADIATCADPAQACAGLSLRSVTIAHNLVQYIQWVSLQQNAKYSGAGADTALDSFICAGLLDALRGAALEGATQMRNNAQSAGPVATMQAQITQLAFESLKLLKELGVDVSG